MQESMLKGSAFRNSAVLRSLTGGSREVSDRLLLLFASWPKC